MQSLWVGSFMRDVSLADAGDAATRAAALVSILGAAFIAGNIGFGMLARVLERRGISVHLFSGVTMMMFVVVQALLVARAPLPAPLLWAAYGAFGGTGILTYAVLAVYFPPQMIGRVNTTFTLVIFVRIFAAQVAIGALLAHWPSYDGRYPAAAHQAVWFGLIALQLAGAVWYFMPARHTSGAVDPAIER